MMIMMVFLIVLNLRGVKESVIILAPIFILWFGYDLAPKILLIVVIALSTLAGATALVIRIDRELRDKPGVVFERPTLFAVAHMLGSWLAGTLAFILAESQNMNDWGELGFIITASFMGAKFIELVAEKYLIKTLPPETKDAP